MKKIFLYLAFALAMCSSSLALVTERTNTVNFILANVCDGTFNDFKIQMAGYDDQKFVFRYDVDLTGVNCVFRITKPIEGTIYYDVPLNAITVSTTNVTWTIARTNIPPPGTYYGELLSYQTGATTNFYRSLAQGKLPITWSLYLNETNYFQRSTTNAQVGQLYIHPSWQYPTWDTNGNVNLMAASNALKNAIGAVQTNLNTFSNFVDTTYAKQVDYQATSNLVDQHTTQIASISNDLDAAQSDIIASSNHFQTHLDSDSVTTNDGNWAGTWQGYQPSAFGGTADLTQAQIDIDELQGQTNTFIKAASDAVNATNDIAGLKTVTNALNTRIGNLEMSTGTLNTAVGNLNTSTATLNTAVANLSNATGNLNIAVGNLQSATGSLNIVVGNLNAATGSLNTAVGNLNNSTNVLNTRAGNLELATGSLNTAVGNLNIATGALNSAVGGLQARTNYWNAAITGATITAGAADSVSIASGNASITWNTNAAGGAGTITNLKSTLGTLTITSQGGPEVNLSINTNNGLTFANNYTQSVYGLIVRDGLLMTNTASGGMVSNVYSLVDVQNDGLTYGRKNGAWSDFGLSGILSTQASIVASTGYLNTAVANLNAATTTLNTAVGNLNTSTAALNTAVGNLNNATNALNSGKLNLSGGIMTGPLTNSVGLYGNGLGLTNVNATNATALGGVAVATWQGATGSLNTAVGNLNSSTAALNTAVANLNASTATLNTAVGNLNTATNSLNANKLNLSGGTMTGALTNDVAIWLPANGIVYFGTSTNYIKDQNGTNFLFMSGTNSANFGW